MAITLVWSLALFVPAADAPVKSIPITRIKRSSAVDFEREVLPILKNNCIACHNQTKPKGGLVMETPQTILKGGDAGPAIVPKKPAESLLLKVAAHQDPELIMPPPDNKVAAVALKPGELGLLQLWIEQGAKGEVRASVPVVWQPMPAGLNAIYAVALTRDGQFAACGRANQIFVYHLPTSRLAARLTDPQLQKTSAGVASHRDTVNSLAFSADGEMLASGGYREVKLWRRVKPAEKFKLPAGSDLVATSGDGKWIAVASTNGEVRILDRSGKLAGTIPSRGSRITALKFAHGSNLLAVARGNRFKFTSVPAGTTMASAELPATITLFASLGALRVAVACGDNVVRILGPGTNAGSLVIMQELESPASVVLLDASAVSTNQLMAGSPDGTVRLWDVAASRAAWEVNHGSELTALAMRPDGKLFASAGGHTAKLWRNGESNFVAELKGDGRLSFLVADQEREVTFAKSEIAYHQSALQTVETNLVAAIARQKKAADTNAALAKITEEKQAALTNATIARREAEKALDDLGPEITKVFDALVAAQKEFTNTTALAKAAKDGADKIKIEKLGAESVTKSNLLAEAKAAVDALPAETKEKQKLAADRLSSANKALIGAEKDFKTAEQTRATAENELNLAMKAVQKSEAAVVGAKTALATAETDLKAAEHAAEIARKTLAQMEQPVRSLAFASDNRTLVTGHEDGSLRTWSADMGMALNTIAVSPGPMRSLTLLGPGTVITATGSSGAVWDLNFTWTLVRAIGTGDANSPLADRVNTLRFTADGQQLFTGGGEPTRGGEIKLWRVKDGVFLREFSNVHSDSVFALDLSADGKYLASGAADRFAKIVDLASGKVVKTLEGHTHHVLGVAWKRDGRTVITAGADNVAKVWNATTGERSKNIEGFGKEINGAAFIGVGDEAVLSAGDAQVVLVKDKGEKVRSFAGAADYVYAAAATPDGNIIVAGGADGVLRAWNGKTGKLIAEFTGR
ncbi:MAG TPA: c-type cytochrome domain-containing protein [Candidatus Limnocylindria bacterium]|nr:c-type cytochrome domain-containing protein [Candidatus Limnocylindria bacterium]